MSKYGIICSIKEKIVKDIYLDDQYQGEDQDYLLGEWLDDSNYDIVINESCKIWKTPNAEGERELLCVFEKNAFSDEDQMIAYEAFNAAVNVTDNRGVAAGPVSEENHQVHSRTQKNPIRKFYYDFNNT